MITRSGRLKNTNNALSATRRVIKIAFKSGFR